MEAIDTLLGRVDRFQQGHAPVAVAWAVNKKYGDDRGGYLAALIAYYGLLSIFPLILVFVSLALYFLSPGSSALHSLEQHLGSFPIIGPSLTQVEGRHLGGSLIAVIVGAAGLVWGAQGLAQTMQYTMNEIWNVPNKARAGFLPRLLITAKWYVSFGVGIALTTYLSSLSAILHWGPAGPVLAALPALVVNVGLFILSFRILSPDEVKTRDLVPGGVAGGVLWTVLTGVGVGLATHQLNHASALYGSLGTVLGILGFLYLAARLTLYSAEYNVVRARRLWPRSLVGPPLVTADKQQLIDMARREERVHEETVRVEF